MPAPTEEQIAQLFAVHNGSERRTENLIRAYGFDSTRTWVDPAGYRLSDRVWRARQAVRDQIDQVLREALANGTDALEVADILEQFLNPAYAPVRNARGRLVRDQKPVIVTSAPGRGGMGSFSARRLARTEISRAHGQATIETAKRTPFAVGVKWNLSGSHPKSDPCDENSRRDDYDLGPGVYPPEKVPPYPNHPQCLCNLSTATESDVDAVVGRLREQYGLGAGEASSGAGGLSIVDIEGDAGSTVTDAMRRMQSAGDAVIPRGTPPIAVRRMPDNEVDFTAGMYRRDLKEIFMNPYRAGPNARLTFYHEYGHYIDNLDGEGATTPAKQAIYDAIRQSRSYTLLRDRRSSGYKLIWTEENGFETVADSAGDFTEYLLTPSELFARAYAQYVAEVTGDDEAMRFVRRHDGETIDPPIVRFNGKESKGIQDMTPKQWAADDFDAIRRAFEEYIRGR
jgi:hypothetical protein